MPEVRKQFKKLDFNNLTYFYKGRTAPVNFISFEGPLHIFKSIYSSDIALKDVEEDKKKLKRKFDEINAGNSRNRSKEQDKLIDNVIDLYESRQKVVQMFNDYPREKSRRRYVSRQERGLRILTPTQILKRFPIALAQISADNNSESLLNEIRQIIILCISQKELLKKYITT